MKIQIGDNIDYVSTAEMIDKNICEQAMLDCKVKDAISIYKKSKTKELFTEEELDSGAFFFFNKKNGIEPEDGEKGILLTKKGRSYFDLRRRKLFINNSFTPNISNFKILEERYKVQKQKIKGGDAI